MIKNKKVKINIYQRNLDLLLTYNNKKKNNFFHHFFILCPVLHVPYVIWISTRTHMNYTS